MRLTGDAHPGGPQEVRLKQAPRKPQEKTTEKARKQEHESQRSEDAMYEKNGEKYYIVDGHVHLWDGSDENCRNIHGHQFIGSSESRV